MSRLHTSVVKCQIIFLDNSYFLHYVVQEMQKDMIFHKEMKSNFMLYVYRNIRRTHVDTISIPNLYLSPPPHTQMLFDISSIHNDFILAYIIACWGCFGLSFSVTVAFHQHLWNYLMPVSFGQM